METAEGDGTTDDGGDPTAPPGPTNGNGTRARHLDATSSNIDQDGNSGVMSSDQARAGDTGTTIDSENQIKNGDTMSNNKDAARPNGDAATSQIQDAQIARPEITPAAHLVIAIDGPAASGKSTIGRALAHALNLLYLDTGTMYRAVTWLALRRGLDPADEAAITALAESAAFGFPHLGETDLVNPPITIDGLDATAGIREPAVDTRVSLVSSYAGVRRALVREQQRIAHARGVVMVGRDIGTVVLPNADLKIFLVAGAAERARRRYEERIAQGKEADYERIRGEMEQRDKLDAERAHSPLRPAADAVMLDTTGLSIQDVIDRALALAHEAVARSARS